MSKIKPLKLIATTMRTKHTRPCELGEPALLRNNCNHLCKGVLLKIVPLSGRFADLLDKIDWLTPIHLVIVHNMIQRG